jgi:hypothetical protein
MKDKFELEGCPREDERCKERRLLINREYNASHSHLQNKDYSRSILALKNAYEKTHELHETSCKGCAELFQSTITESLEYIHEDLYKMSTGLFGTKRFKSSFELAGVVLKEMKKQI